ncbi:MAG: hypothetical protein E6G94_03715 [Alphaproteobacteria bacterium]|nr:MAG: hypothetical protein E6G94_03715 [Alphaproteobacteria bacterium]
MTFKPIAFAAAACLAGTLSSSAFAAPATSSLCNAAGKVEVLSRASSVDCGDGAAQEMKALRKARGLYSNNVLIDWKDKMAIETRIENRLRVLSQQQSATRG